MKIVGFDYNELQNNGVYMLGESVELQALNKLDCNELLKTVLSTDIRADKYMTRYTPYNKIIFDKDLFDNGYLSDNLSFTVDASNEAILVGRRDKYKQFNGYLVFSGVLSENGLLERDIKLRMYKYNRANLILDKVLLLALGILKDNKVYGLWYVPNEKGIGIEVNGVVKSTVTEESINADTWSSFTLKDWVRGTKIKRREVKE